MPGLVLGLLLACLARAFLARCSLDSVNHLSTVPTNLVVLVLQHTAVLQSRALRTDHPSILSNLVGKVKARAESHAVRFRASVLYFFSI